MGMVNCIFTCPYVVGATGIGACVAGFCCKVGQAKCRDCIKMTMIVSAIILAISTFLLFTYGNPGASGGPMTQRPLSAQSGWIGIIMAITFGVPLVLSVVYPCYGDSGCLDLKYDPLTSKEGGSPPAKYDPVVICLGILNWGLVVAFVGLIVWANVGHKFQVSPNHNAGEVLTGGQPFNGTVI
mmetsp:Transcript_32388/g.57293  ORF Transcript_32388/g.57293 Transcript_32388/m.57293 type:complete len:183 (-) Transcript_32388:98-646(-)